MATKNEKVLAWAICRLTDLVSLLKPELAELWESACESQKDKDGKIPDRLESMRDLFGSDNPIRKLAEDIMAQGTEEPAVPKVGLSKDNRFYYSGLDQVLMTQAERNELPGKVCKFSVTYQGKVIFEAYWDKNLDWIMYPKNAEKTEFGYACKKPFGSKNAKTSGGPAQFLQKLAKAELEKPGSFAKAYYPPDWLMQSASVVKESQTMEIVKGPEAKSA